jgi:hypothetical protein
METPKRDIFICHASEDKDDVVRPMAESFSQEGISCWYDEAEIKWGDSITQKVNEGLRISRYVIVVLSSAFMAKKWPQRELNAALNIEASSGEVKVLPLLVGTENEKTSIIAAVPLLNDKRYLPWDGDLKKVVEAIQKRLGSQPRSHGTKTGEGHGAVGLRIPLPKIKKTFSQRDRDLFLRTAFTVVKQYFKNALDELNRHYQEVETDFAEVHNFKFVCTIYVRGEVANRCKIWLGGYTSSDSIAYQEGQHSIDSDNSYNDMLSVGDNEHVLGFKTSNFLIAGQKYSEKDILTTEQAAEYLWRRFTDGLK